MDSPGALADLDWAMRLLEASSDHRVLRRLPPPSAWGLAAREGPSRRGLFIDVKTSGPSLDADEIMELGALAFEYDAHSGSIVATQEPVALDDPAEADLQAMADGADIIIAHDAAFVRPMVEKRCAVFARKNWAGVLNEIDWASEGLGTARVDDLLMRLGWFNDSVDVQTHACAGVFLMGLALPRSGLLVLQALLNRARRQLAAVRAHASPFEKRELLKQRGYRWDGGSRPEEAAWWILTDTPQTEIAWLNAMIYPSPQKITPIPMPASRRYSMRLWTSD